MFDIKWIVANPVVFDQGLAKRGLDPLSADLIALDEKRRLATAEAQEIQTERNIFAKQIGVLKAKGADASDLISQVSRSKQLQAEAEQKADAAANELNSVLAGIPNLPYDDVPVGKDENDNVVVRSHGTPKSFDFEPRQHFEIGEMLGMMDFDRASKLAGARFVVLKGPLARMERALAAFMLDMHTLENGYTEINPPALVNDETLFGTGQLPKFSEDLFKTEDGLWLIPTAEVPLTSLVAGDIVDADSLPRRYTAMTWCFRSEAGSAGRDTRGMIRQHQFTKVEMVSVTRPEDSNDELERMTSCAEEVLKRLGLPFQTIVLCTGDMGFGARKTYDIEVWLPGQDKFREISSCSTCGDFQARRMKARMRQKGGKGTEFVHTLNGSGLAVGRTLVAVLENYQLPDGRVEIPEALRPYMGGQSIIEPFQEA